MRCQRSGPLESGICARTTSTTEPLPLLARSFNLPGQPSLTRRMFGAEDVEDWDGRCRNLLACYGDIKGELTSYYVEQS